MSAQSANFETGILITTIKVADRHRRDLGDLTELRDSIAAVGLLNPVTITSDGRLIAGQRRLEAVKMLGWSRIDARTADNVTDAIAELAAERDENTCRKEMTPSECIALGRALEALEKPKAKERMAEGGRGGVDGTRSVRTNGPSRYDTREVVAPAVGMSTASYSRAKQLIDAAADDSLPEKTRESARAAVAEMDATGKVTPAYEKFKGRRVNDAPVKANKPPAPPRFGGNRRKHNAQLDALVISLTGLADAFEGVTELDESVTSEEATRLTGDLFGQIQRITRINRLIKERTK